MDRGVVASMSVRTPHLALPFRFTGGQAAVLEQDSTDEITQCAEVILRYRRGQRSELPAFGIPEQAFRPGGASLDELRQAVTRWEPRAIATIDTDGIAELAQRVKIEIAGGGNA